MQSLTERVYDLAPPGGYFDATVVRNLFVHESKGARKLLVHRAVHAGEVLRLRPGVYMLDRRYRKTELHPFVIAAILHFPSYISLQSALAHHGLIPEAVYQVSSVTTARSRVFTTSVGVFSFACVTTAPLLAGVEAVKLGRDVWAFVATPLRAIADLVYLSGSVSWSRDGLRYLKESLRVEESDLAALPSAESQELCDSIRDRRTREYLLGLCEELHD